MAASFGLGAFTLGLMPGMTFAIIAGFALTGQRLSEAYQLSLLRLQFQRGLTKSAEDSKSEIEKAYNEVCDDNAANGELIDRLLAEITALNGEIADGRTKTALIEALQRRVKNISAEYNDKKMPHRATTLADVYKLTGEGNVR